MKQYPKTYEDLTKFKVVPESCGCIDGDLNAYIKLYRSFLHSSHLQFFDIIVRQVWLEMRFSVNGRRKNRRGGNGHYNDAMYGAFMHQMVGINPKPITNTISFNILAKYLREMFPEFLNKNPFTEPEYFAFPFKHVTLDFCVFVYQMDNRMEMLQYADDKGMSYEDFSNWATNWAFSYNEEIGREKYVLALVDSIWPYLSNKDLKSNEKALYYDFKYDGEK